MLEPALAQPTAKGGRAEGWEMPGSTRASGFTRVSATTSLHIPTGSRHGSRPATAPAARPASALPKSKPVASAVTTERKGTAGSKLARVGRVVEKKSGVEGGAQDVARSRSAGAKKKVRRAAGAGALVEEQDGGATRPAVLTATAPPAPLLASVASVLWWSTRISKQTYRARLERAMRRGEVP